MAAAADRLTLADFERQYGDLKPYHEYWFGEAVPKAMPTWLHGLLQLVIGALLKEAGYKAGSEIKLRISPDFEPVPDVIATLGPIELPYPTKPIDVVVELLSPEDSFRRVVRKCRMYADWGIPVIAVLDPEGREGWAWDRDAQALQPTAAIVLNNGNRIAISRIFEELDASME
jgi:Uma2 family endonuclease